MVSELTHSGKSLIKSTNNKGPSIEPCGTPDKTGFELDFVPLITTHWVRSFRYAT